MWRTQSTLAGRFDDVPNAAPSRAGMTLILALETSCDDTCAAVVTGDGELRSNVISSQGIHDAYGGVVPEIASRHHLELANAVVDDALRRAGATLDDVGLVAVTQGPGLVGALLVGVATAKGIAAARGLPLAPVDHLQGHVAANFLRLDPDAATPEPSWSRRSSACIASGGHTLLARVEEHDGFDGPRPHARRRRRRGVRQGRAAARAAVPRRPGARAARPRRRPAGVRVPDRAQPRRAGLLLRRRQDVAAVPRARPRRPRPRASARPTSPRATSTRSSRRSRCAASRRSSRPACERLAIGGGVAANGPLRERLGALGVAARHPAARAVHRQRGDDRLGGALRRAAAVSPPTSRSTPTPRASAALA